MSKDKEDIDELVEYSFSFKEGNYIKKIYYERETEKAVMFGRNEDDKILWIPKGWIKGGWKKDKKYPQNISIKAPAKLFWKPRRNILLETLR